VRVPALIVSALVLAGCGLRGCGSPAPEGARSLECTQSTPLILGDVDLCEDAAALVESASAQLLVDTSGSMAGFTKTSGQRSALTRIHEWVASALSGLGGDQKAMTLKRVAVFNRVDGMTEVGDVRALETLTARGDTTLDRAVQEAEKASLTLIVTDGVPFIGSEAAADCAAGADPGCVARRLIEYVQRRTAAGVALVPIVAAFDGAFFSEGQDVPADNAAAAVIEESVKRSFPRSDVRLALRPGATPPMVYRGPRSLLLLVVAEDERLARAFLRLLLERAGLAQVQTLDGDWSAFDNRERSVGVMTPIEVYPGYLPPARRIERTRVGDPEGTIDVTSKGAGEQLAVEIGCRAGDPGHARERLSFSSRPRGAGSCRKLRSLASATFSLCPKDEASEDERKSLGSAVREVAFEAGAGGADGPLAVTLDLACDSAPGPDCAAGGAPLRLAATIEYGASAERLASESGSGRSNDSIDYVLGLSTSDLPRNPHRVLGLNALLTQFLRGVSSAARSHPIGALTLCERRGDK
jgi:hypothetical protein